MRNQIKCQKNEQRYKQIFYFLRMKKENEITHCKRKRVELKKKLKLFVPVS